MPRAVILTVDDDRAVSTAVARDLRRRYGSDFRIVRAESGAQALDVLRTLALRGQPVALIATDQRMPGMTGTEMLAEAIELAPGAKTLLLTAYSDTDVAIAAINEIGLDYYLLKPWDPPEDKLYPVVDDLLDDWRQEHPEATTDVRVVGNRWSDRAHDLKTFLATNHVPYAWLDVERDPEAARLVELAAAGTEDLPLVLLAEGEVLRRPTTMDLATGLGLRTTASRPLYDVCIVGGGPAGLAAAVYAASEGLSAVVVERAAPGGQAGQSAAIENYLGFPRGVSGADLAQRALTQARRFGAEMVLARDASGLEVRGPVRAVTLAGGGEVEARAVIIATGVSYRRLAADGADELIGRGVYYGANASEAPATSGEEVVVVGGANSAGQAALNLAQYAKRVVVVVRGEGLGATMSSYLSDRILNTPNIEVRTRTEVTAVRGDGHLEEVTLTERSTGSSEVLNAQWLYVFIGALPRTDWLGPSVVRDERGFVLTGPGVSGGEVRWPLKRDPYALETSLPGVFAAGDVRLDSMKRVASAVGEGAMSVYLTHLYLAAT
jgi:thioredoxin reductase (NADPH)